MVEGSDLPELKEASGSVVDPVQPEHHGQQESEHQDGRHTEGR